MNRSAEAARNDNGDLIAAVTMALARAVAANGEATTFAGRKQSALAISNEAVRKFLESELQRGADSEPEIIGVHAGQFKRHQPGTATYHSLCGPVRIRRWTYRPTLAQARHRSLLTVRSLLESKRFDEFWHRFAQRYAPLAIAA